MKSFRLYAATQILWLAIQASPFCVTPEVLAGGVSPSKASNLVTLGNDPTEACNIIGQKVAIRLQSDGSLGFDYAVPAGQVLIVTGFDWAMTGTSPNSLQTVAIVNDFALVLLEASAMSDATGAAAGHLDVSGLAVKANTTPATNLCLVGPGSLQNSYLHGFLVSDK